MPGKDHRKSMKSRILTEDDTKGKLAERMMAAKLAGIQTWREETCFHPKKRRVPGLRILSVKTLPDLYLSTMDSRGHIQTLAVAVSLKGRFNKVQLEC